MFVEREVFKTAHFCDHPVEDIIERVSVQPTDSAARGRPKVPGAFYPGWPLYVCSTRYIDKAQIFLRIKKWSSIIPEGRRHIDVSTVVPFQRPITLPMLKSPFLDGVTGPGMIGRPRRQPIPADSEEVEAEVAYSQPAISRRTSELQPERAPSAPSSQRQTPIPSQPQPSRPQTQRSSSSTWSQSQRPAPTFSSRTFASIVGGAQVLEQVAVREYLPSDTARLFEQDARHQVLWFSGPPVAQGAVAFPSQPGHSLEYLTWLSKRKRGESVELSNGKRFCRTVEPDASGGQDAEGEVDADGESEDTEEKEDLSLLWWAKGQSEEQVLGSLRAVIGE